VFEVIEKKRKRNSGGEIAGIIKGAKLVNKSMAWTKLIATISLCLRRFVRRSVILMIKIDPSLHWWNFRYCEEIIPVRTLRSPRLRMST